MSYTHERDQFISSGTREGLSLDTCRQLLRYATTLHRLQEAQCNGDWPYNGDRDRPLAGDSLGAYMTVSRERWDKRYTQCPKCEASGVAKSAMRFSSTLPKFPAYKVCPDCRTQELVQALLQEHSKPQCVVYHPLGHKAGEQCQREVKAHFNGDPRGAVLVLETPGHPWSEDGRGRGLYVPAR